MNTFDEIELIVAGFIAGVIGGVVISSAAYVTGAASTIALSILCALFSVAWVLLAEFAKWVFNKVFGGKKC